MKPEDAVMLLNEKFGRMDEHLFEIESVAENFFGEYVVALKVNRMVKASYVVLDRIAKVTGAKDILIEECSGDNLVEIKLLLPKK